MKGFAIGAALIAFSTLVPTLTGEKQINLRDLGWWIDTIVQMAIGGVVVGGIFLLFTRRKSS